MKNNFIKTFFAALSLVTAQVFAQQKVTGSIKDEEHVNMSAVSVLNITKNISAVSDVSGNFTIEADENDELRFVKESYYRTDKIIKKESFTNPMNVMLLRAETLIPEVKIEYRPTGNLEKDNQHLNDSKKVAKLKSSMEEYMKSPISEPIAKNEIPKTFQGHDFNAGQVNVINVIDEAVRLIKKASAPKITAPTFGETQDFLKRVKSEIDLSFLKRYGMNEEGIDHFLYYAERVNHLSKRFRKTFKPSEIEYELKTAFVEYSKLNKLSGE